MIRLRILLCPLLVLTMITAGCLSGDEAPEAEADAQADVEGDTRVSPGDGDVDASGNASASGNVSGDTGSGNASVSGNASASGNVSANGTGAPPQPTLEANVTNGSAPLDVSFLVDAEDPEGDGISWTFDSDGDGTSDQNGTEVPATVNVTFNETGNFTVVLNVTDGNSSAQVNVTIEVAETGPDMCHRDHTAKVGPFYLDNRGTGGGIWLYQESNDVEGLQVGHPEDESDEYKSCENPDTLIF